MIYQYACQVCKIELEVERSIHAEASNPMCRDCGEMMSRIWSAPPVKFNAPGFYSTDN